MTKDLNLDGMLAGLKDETLVDLKVDSMEHMMAGLTAMLLVQTMDCTMGLISVA